MKKKREEYKDEEMSLVTLNIFDSVGVVRFSKVK